MDRKLLVLGCSQVKRDSPGLLPAIERYDGSPYRVLRSYLRTHEWPEELSVAILSARYGLVGGFTGIEDYDERMTKTRASEWAPVCQETLNQWALSHGSMHFSLGKDYLPAVTPSFENYSDTKIEIFEGPIGMKLSQIKGLLEGIDSDPKRSPTKTTAGSGKVSYFLPDWDDLLDPKFDFQEDSFSGSSRAERGDKHCCVLMKPKRMCDGVLVSLAQHVTSKGPLRRILGTETSSLAPKKLRQLFELDDDQSLFGDCGAFSYVNEELPAISVDQAISLYELHGFDFGASVDHIPVPKVFRNGKKINLSKQKRKERVDITKQNAAHFIRLAKERRVNFTPVGTIQALSPEDYAKMALAYHDMGYRHLAIGGLVPLNDGLVEEIATKVMTTIQPLKPRPWVHLFGIFRPKLQSTFRALGIDSFDSATYFRKSWLRSDQNYLAKNGQWYAALRVPMTSDGRTRKRLEASGEDIAVLEKYEQKTLELLARYDQNLVGVAEVLDALVEYDSRLTRTSDSRSLKQKYFRTLNDRPWKMCDCPFCKNLGIHILIFRGSNRNKRRGAHNTLMLYGSLKGFN